MNRIMIEMNVYRTGKQKIIPSLFIKQKKYKLMQIIMTNCELLRRVKRLYECRCVKTY